VKGGQWFLPEAPDVVALLRRQVGLTIAGLDAFAAWSRGDATAAEAVREAEQRGNATRRELLKVLHAAFVIPLEPEDLFALSRGVDRILNYACDLVDESDAMACPPDGGIAEMATLLGEAMRHIDAALESLESSGSTSEAAADRAIETVRRLDRVYYRGMAGSLDVEDRSERIAIRELHRRCSRIGETVVDTAERIIYAVVKQS
jgi:uncharacterized protein Yka (UPF0111/DUF47 family)